MKVFKIRYSFLLLLLVFFSFSTCAQKNSNSVNVVEIETLKKGDFTHSSFKSISRGEVNFNVYLPSDWSQNNASKYPLIILLHGQGENEYTFLNAFPSSSLNNWIKNNQIPEFVIVSLSGEANTNDMQWFFDENVTMITSEFDGELRKYCNQMFNTSMESSKISVIGHSRGATGALNFATKYPSKFASVVSSAFVSDYFVERLIQATDQNLNEILKSNIKINMFIGSEDQFALNHNRQGSKIISSYFEEKNIPHIFKTIEGKSHTLSDLWEYPTNLNYLKFCAKTWNSNVN